MAGMLPFFVPKTTVFESSPCLNSDRIETANYKVTRSWAFGTALLLVKSRVESRTGAVTVVSRVPRNTALPAREIDQDAH
jgi:hypothetical protein